MRTGRPQVLQLVWSLLSGPVPVDYEAFSAAGCFSTADGLVTQSTSRLAPHVCQVLHSCRSAYNIELFDSKHHCFRIAELSTSCACRPTCIRGRKSGGGWRVQCTMERADSRNAFSLYTALLRAPPALPTCGANLESLRFQAAQRKNQSGVLGGGVCRPLH